MRAGEDGMTMVRAELCQRLEALQALSRRRSGRQFSESVDGIRRLAAVYGLTAVVRVADAMERAVAEDGGACPKSLYLGRLQDAIGCDGSDDSAAEAMLASVSVRLCA